MTMRKENIRLEFYLDHTDMTPEQKALAIQAQEEINALTQKALNNLDYDNLSPELKQQVAAQFMTMLDGIELVKEPA